MKPNDIFSTKKINILTGIVRKKILNETKYHNLVLQWPDVQSTI